MIQTNFKTISEAYELLTSHGEHSIYQPTTSFKCPFPDCGIYAQHHWGKVTTLSVEHGQNRYSSRNYTGGTLFSAHCRACERESLILEGQLLWPAASQAPAPTADLPEDLLADYNEARDIHAKSPRGAAALLRLLIQKLCLALGSSEKDINAAIGSFVAEGRISPAIQKALDAVRVVGNEAVHPGVMDLKDDEATVNSMFGLINFIVEKMITEPKEIDSIYNSLPPGKLAGIAARDSAA